MLQSALSRGVRRALGASKKSNFISSLQSLCPHFDQSVSISPHEEAYVHTVLQKPSGLSFTFQRSSALRPLSKSSSFSTVVCSTQEALRFPGSIISIQDCVLQNTSHPLGVPFRAYRGAKAQPSPVAPQTSQKATPPPPVVYQGVFSSTLRSVKLLSLSTCALSLSIGPIVTFFTIAPSVNIVVKGAMASIMVLLSASTTAALHWISSAYVHKLTWTPGSDEVEVKVLSWMTTTVTRKVKLSSVRPAVTMKPLVSFEADGSFYYIDKDSFPDRWLLEQLTPEEKGVSGSEK